MTAPYMKVEIAPLFVDGQLEARVCVRCNDETWNYREIIQDAVLESYLDRWFEIVKRETRTAMWTHMKARP